MCEVIDLEEQEWHYPNIDIPEGHTAKSYYRQLCYDNLPKKFPINTMKKEEYDTIIERLEYEIEVIDKMNSSAYTLIDQDFIVWAKDNGIVVGPGRGSACGSLSAYLTGITDINPLDYTLLFERFMSPERVTMPDYIIVEPNGNIGC
ncbi:MAG: hypothetical protein IJH34_05405 [Romboutsia sp.]|nr:hypothetical protein [Romboutsia sp.]